MTYYIVIGLCIFLLLAVIYFSIKPISMGIEARRNIKENANIEDLENENNLSNDLKSETNTNNKISDEILKLSELKTKGLLSEEEFEKAKEKLLS